MDVFHEMGTTLYLKGGSPDPFNYGSLKSAFN